MTQPVYRLIADTPRSQAQSIRSVIVISGYLPFGNNCRDISVMAQSPTVTIVVIGTVTRIILGISIQSLIGSAMAGMVFAATTQDHFGLATASQYLGIGARFTI